MASNLTIESLDFDQIEHDAKSATRNGLYLIWLALNNEIKLRRQLIKDTKDTDEGKIFSTSPTAQVDNLDVERSATVLFEGTTNFTLTGIRNGVEGQRLILFNNNTATITLGHDNAGSDAANRMLLDTGANKTLAQNAAIMLLYLASRWREANWL